MKTCHLAQLYSALIQFRQTKLTNRKADRQAERQTDRQTDRRLVLYKLIL